MQIKSITSAIIMLTNKCNLACPYCFEKHNTDIMSLDTAQQTINFLQSNCIEGQHIKLCFFGGEPMLHFNDIIVPLVQQNINSKYPISYGMTTNGTLLSFEKLEFLKKHNIYFMLSFDGLKEIQDAQRPMLNGQSSFDIIMNQMQNIKNSGLCSTIRSTLSSSWLDQLYKNIMFIESLPIKNYHLLPNLWEKWTEKERIILREQLKLYELYIIEKFRQNQLPLLFIDYSLGFWRIAASLTIQKRRNTVFCLPENKCGVGLKGSCTIDPKGDIYGCHHITPLTPNSMWYLGNIYDGIKLEKIKSLISLYDKNKIGNQYCASCPIDSICDGGCLPTNFMINNDVNKVPSTFCIWTQELTDSAYRVAKILGDENNKLFQSIFLRKCQYR